MCAILFSIKQHRTNNNIQAQEVRVIDETGKNLGIISRDEALRLARERQVDLIEITSTITPPVCRLMNFDKFRYQKEKEEKKQRQSQKAKEMKQVRVTPRAAANDLQIKASQIEKFLEEGHQVEVNLFMRGREKGNRAWSLQKLHEFLALIKIPHEITMQPTFSGKGFVTQLSKRK